MNRGVDWEVAVFFFQIEQVHLEQASADFYQLAELVKDYIGLVAAVKDVFQVMRAYCYT